MGAFDDLIPNNNRPQGSPVRSIPLGRDPKQAGQIENTNASTASTRAATTKTYVDTTKTNQDIRQKPISEKDQEFINGMRGSASEMGGLLNIINQTAHDVDTFRTDPVRNFMARIAIPKAEDSGPLDQFGAWVGNGWFTQPEKEAYQRLQALQNRFVLKDQSEQKGPQTEGDAIRMKLANAGPGQYKGVNTSLLSNATLQARIAQERPNFYVKWANKYGALNAPDRNGQTVDKAWKAYTDNIYNSTRQRHQQRQNATPAALPSGWSIQRIK